MAFSELERKQVEKELAQYLENNRRPPPHIRPKLDLGYRITDQSFEIFEIRPDWPAPGQTSETACAKATYVKSRKVWRLYWMRQDMKWHGYKPELEHKSLESVLAAIERDQHGCFYG